MAARSPLRINSVCSTSAASSAASAGMVGTSPLAHTHTMFGSDVTVGSSDDLASGPAAAGAASAASSGASRRLSRQ